MEVADNS